MRPVLLPLSEEPADDPPELPELALPSELPVRLPRGDAPEVPLLPPSDGRV